MTIIPGIATAATSVEIIPSIQTVVPGEKFTLEILIKPDTLITGVQFDLDYDTTLVTIDRIDEKAFFQSNDSAIMSNSGSINDSTGTVSRIYRSIIKGNASAEESSFCTIKLIAEHNEGNCEFSITNLAIWDEQGKEVPSITIDAAVTIDKNKALASTTDNTEMKDLNTPVSELSKAPGWLVLIFAVIAFSAVAYYIDKKN